MKTARIDEYLEDQLANYLTKPKGTNEWFRIPAIKLLQQSTEYKKRHWQRLRFVAKDLKQANLAHIKLAQKHPDIFHPNVALARVEENTIYDQVIALIKKTHTAAPHP